MKKVTVLFSALAFLLVVGMTSCDNECMDCTTLGITEKICEDDFGSKDEYDLAIQAFELLGDCK